MSAPMKAGVYRLPSAVVAADESVGAMATAVMQSNLAHLAESSAQVLCASFPAQAAVNQVTLVGGERTLLWQSSAMQARLNRLLRFRIFTRTSASTSTTWDVVAHPSGEDPAIYIGDANSAQLTSATVTPGWRAGANTLDISAIVNRLRTVDVQSDLTLGGPAESVGLYRVRVSVFATCASALDADVRGVYVAEAPK